MPIKEKGRLSGDPIPNAVLADASVDTTPDSSLQVSSSILRTALSLASRGIPVFPCKPDKSPYTTNGFYGASIEPGVIEDWLKRWPDALLGVPTGKPSGLAVLDLDITKHKEAREWLAANKSRLPDTRRHRTRSGGWHLLFKDREGLRCSAGKIALGVDIRATGGFVIWWPAHLGGVYSSHIAPFPDWLVPPPPPEVTLPPAGVIRSGNYGRAALEAEVRQLAGVPSGGRNHALNRAAFRLFQLVGAGRLDRGEVESHLIDACQCNGLIKDDGLASVRKTIRSGAAAGLRNPRRVA